MSERTYRLSGDSPKAALDALAAGVSKSTRRRTDSGLVVTYWDTFDGRLWRRGWTLTTTRRTSDDPDAGRVLRLRNVDGDLLARLPTTEPPGMADGLPPGRLRNLVAPEISMRRLLERARLTIDREVLEVLDDRDKTVARAAVETGDVASPGHDGTEPLEPRLYVRGVRGYDRALERVSEAVDDLDATEAVSEDRLETALRAWGTRPDAYSSKLDVELDPDLRADAATRVVLRHLLDTLRANEEGTKADLDSEFLHDFRVAVRRTRSALAQVKKVFPDDTVRRFKEDFRWLGRITGTTRDLDVYLLKLDGYRESLPEPVRADLDPLEAHLERRQREEQRTVARQLESPTYRKLLEDWEDFLNAELPEDPEPDNALRPVRDVASERISKFYRRVRKKGKSIGPDTPDVALHRLRIDCKKLRYLMEFFRSLYPDDEISPLVKALKKLQDVLGDFNDLSVQQDALDDFAREITEAGDVAPGTLLAMGRLQQVFESHKAKERKKFHKRFRRFGSKKSRRRVRELFGKDRS